MTLDILRGVQGIGAAATIPASVCPSLTRFAIVEFELTRLL
jgi:hypothetical protein